jgi:hypothetical protein
LLELFKLPDKKKNNKNKERIKKHECILKQFNQWVLSQSEQKPNASNRDKKRNQLDWLVPDENIVLQVEQDQYNSKHKQDFSQKSISYPFVKIGIQCVNKYKNIEVNPRELFYRRLQMMLFLRSKTARNAFLKNWFSFSRIVLVI